MTASVGWGCDEIKSSTAISRGLIEASPASVFAPGEPPVIHGDQPWPHGSIASKGVFTPIVTVIHGDQPWPHGSDLFIRNQNNDKTVIHGDQPWPHGSFTRLPPGAPSAPVIHGDQPWPHGSGLE